MAESVIMQRLRPVLPLLLCLQLLLLLLLTPPSSGASDTSALQVRPSGSPSTLPVPYGVHQELVS